MKRQNVRKLVLIISLLAFPLTLYYFSPALIITASMEGIINGSFIVFATMLVCSVFLGRLFCSYLCPAGGLQECLALAQKKPPKKGWRSYIKYAVWLIWISVVVASYVYHGETLRIDFLFETEHGISVANIYGYIIYYGIIALILLPAVIGGKRAFCHYFCWMAPFMILGTKIRRTLGLPGVRISADPSKCTSCLRCNKGCPMSLDVNSMVKTGGIDSVECIQCGECVDGFLSYTMSKPLSSLRSESSSTMG